MVNPFFLEIVNRQTADGERARLLHRRAGAAAREHAAASTSARRDPFAEPAINYSFLATEQDRRTAVAAVRRAREIAGASPIADVIAAEIAPGPQVRSDEEISTTSATPAPPRSTWWAPARWATTRCRWSTTVCGCTACQGLRVADASIMPMIVSGNTSIPCMMIGEKCADMVLAEHEAGPARVTGGTPALQPKAELADAVSDQQETQDTAAHGDPNVICFKVRPCRADRCRPRLHGHRNRCADLPRPLHPNGDPAAGRWCRRCGGRMLGEKAAGDPRATDHLREPPGGFDHDWYGRRQPRPSPTAASSFT